MDDKYRQSLGQVLAARRRAAGLNKQQMSLMVGVSRITIRKIENGEANPRIGTLLRIAHGLGISLADALVDCERVLAGRKSVPPSLPNPSEFRQDSEVWYFLTRL